MRALHGQHGPDLPPLLADWFSSAPAVSQEQAEQTAKAFRYWIDGDSAAAGSVIADLIEPLVRGVCRQLGINVTRSDALTCNYAVYRYSKVCRTMWVPAVGLWC